jgi:RNA polymerase sigma-70 factor (ECF subfamily)
MLFRLVGESALSDLTQEAFMKAWEHRSKFRGDSEASTWLYRISYNCAVDYLRKNKKQSILEAEDTIVESQERNVSDRQIVELMLTSLDIEHRATVILYYFEDQGVKDIALSLGIAEGTVKSRLSHARTKMMDFLEKKGVRS